ncbi:MAG: thymidine kinase [Bacilli bacterium]|nr:thymidine kinase [Bacilli bacterium]
MAKMYFRYAAMGGGKTLHLLQVVNNYERIGKKCLITKPAIDDKANDRVQTRLGLEKECDFLIYDYTTFEEEEIIGMIKNSDCICIDEAQFLLPEQVMKLYEITKIYNVPVICYGLRSRVNAMPFRGSAPILTIADDIEEIKSICDCGKKANFQIRYVNKVLDIGDEEVVIDKPENNVEYKSLCGDCYVKLRLENKKILKKVNNN